MTDAATGEPLLEDAPKPEHNRADSKTRRATRIWSGIREFLLIVAGVLTALYAQATWEAHLERQTEREYLAQVREDARETLRGLTGAISAEELGGAQTDGILTIMRNSDAPVIRSDTTLFSRPFVPPAYPSIVMGTAEALLSTGTIRSVKDGNTRAAVVRYVSVMRENSEQFDRWRDRGIGHAEAFIFLWETQVKSSQLADAVSQMRSVPSAREAFRGMTLASFFRLRHLRGMHKATQELLQALGDAAS